MSANESRLAEAAPENLRGGGSALSLRLGADLGHEHAPTPRLTEELVRDAISDPLACVVVLMDSAGKVSRRTFFTLAAAERAVERARRRGGDASVALVRLQLVAVVGGEGR